MSQTKKQKSYKESLIFDKQRSVTMFSYQFSCNFNFTIKDNFCNAREFTQ